MLVTGDNVTRFIKIFPAPVTPVRRVIMHISPLQSSIAYCGNITNCKLGICRADSRRETAGSEDIAVFITDIEYQRVGRVVINASGTDKTGIVTDSTAEYFDTILSQTPA